MQSCSLPAAAAGVTAMSLSTAYWSAGNQKGGGSLFYLPSTASSVMSEWNTVAISSKFRRSFYLQCFTEDGEPGSMDNEDTLSVVSSCCRTFWKATKGMDGNNEVTPESEFSRVCTSQAATELQASNTDPIVTYYLQQAPLTSTSAWFQPADDIDDTDSWSWEHAAWAGNEDVPYQTWKGESSVSIEKLGNQFLDSVIGSLLSPPPGSMTSNLSTLGGMHRDWHHDISHVHAGTIDEVIQYRLHLSSDVFINVEDAVEVLTPGYTISLSTASPVIDQEAPAFDSPQHSVLVTLRPTEHCNTTNTEIKTRTKLHLRYPRPSNNSEHNFVQFELSKPTRPGQLPWDAPTRVWTATGYQDDYMWMLGGSIVASLVGALQMLYYIIKSTVASS